MCVDSILVHRENLDSSGLPSEKTRVEVDLAHCCDYRPIRDPASSEMRRLILHGHLCRQIQKS